MSQSFFARMTAFANGVNGSAPPPVPELPRRDNFTVELPSAMPGAAFQATFNLYWYGPANLLWDVRRTFQSEAERISGNWSVTQVGNLVNAMNQLAVQRWQQQLPAGVRLHSAAVSATVSDAARSSAEAADAVRRQMAVERLQQEAEQERLRYLREQVLSRPDVSRSYWLQRHPEALKDLKEDHFEKVAEKFAGSGESSVVLIAKVLERFLVSLDATDTRYLLEQLEKVFINFNRVDLAEEMLSVRASPPKDDAG